jgi:hypothetical protein
MELPKKRTTRKMDQTLEKSDEKRSDMRKGNYKLRLNGHEKHQNKDK